MEAGTIAHWRDVEGYGFIRPDDGSVDVFLHRRALEHGVEIQVGDRIEFVAGMRDRGPYATEARLL